MIDWSIEWVLYGGSPFEVSEVTKRVRVARYRTCHDRTFSDGERDTGNDAFHMAARENANIHETQLWERISREIILGEPQKDFEAYIWVRKECFHAKYSLHRTWIVCESAAS